MKMLRNRSSIWLLFSIIILFICLDYNSANSDSNDAQYNNLQVIRIQPKNHFQMISILQLEQDLDNVDFWKRPNKINQTADLMLTPENRDFILKFLNQRNIYYKIFIENVRKLIENERKEMLHADQLKNFTRNLKFKNNEEPNEWILDGFWNKYQRLDSIEELLNFLKNSEPNLISLDSIGKSFENRNLFLIKFSLNDGNESKPKPIVYIQGGIHAREWISPAMVTYMAYKLFEGYQQKQPEILQLLQTYDFYLVPVLNPDGYEYTHTNYRLWRKTRSTTASQNCPGVDPNRNYDYKWGGTGTSSNPCSEIYRGPESFSEPETEAERNFLENLKSSGRQVKVLLAIHSYGQYWLYPWGYDSLLTPDDKDLNRMAKIATEAIYKNSGKRYTYGTSTNVLYAAAGATDDWAYGSMGIKYSYTVELRDTGSYGFQLPASQIIPTSEETLAGIIAMLKEIKIYDL